MVKEKKRREIVLFFYRFHNPVFVLFLKIKRKKEEKKMMWWRLTFFLMLVKLKLFLLSLVADFFKTTEEYKKRGSFSSVMFIQNDKNHFSHSSKTWRRVKNKFFLLF
jgi:hypothetical protein